MKKLINKVFVVEPWEVSDTGNLRELQAGERYSYFQDEETGKWYRPIEGFTVNGEDLSSMFIEVLPRG